MPRAAAGDREDEAGAGEGGGRGHLGRARALHQQPVVEAAGRDRRGAPDRQPRGLGGDAAGGVRRGDEGRQPGRVVGIAGQIAGAGRAGDLGPVAQPAEAERRRRAAGPVARVEGHRLADEARAGERRRPRHGRRRVGLRHGGERQPPAPGGRAGGVVARHRQRQARLERRQRHADLGGFGIDGDGSAGGAEAEAPGSRYCGHVWTSCSLRAGADADPEGERRRHQRPTTRVALVPVASTRTTRTGKSVPAGTAPKTEQRAVRHPHRQVAGAADVERARHRREVAAVVRRDRRAVLGRGGQAAGMPAEAVGHRALRGWHGDRPRTGLARARPLAIWGMRFGAGPRRSGLRRPYPAARSAAGSGNARARPRASPGGNPGYGPARKRRTPT